MFGGSTSLNHKSKQIPRIFRRRRNSTSRTSDSPLPPPPSTSNENVLAPVRPTEEYFDQEETTDILMNLKESSRIQTDKVLQLSGHNTKTIDDIERWLKNTTEPLTSTGVNIKNSSNTTMERYLNENLPEVFFDRDSLTADIDTTTRKLNVNYDNIFNELHNEKLLSAYSKNEDVFILPDLQLDNLDQLMYCSDDTILTGEGLPSTSVQSSLNNVNTNTKDLIIRLQETINKISDNDRIVENLQAQDKLVEEVNEHEQLKHEVNNCELYAQEESYTASLPIINQDLMIDNVSYKESNVNNKIYFTNTVIDDANAKESKTTLQTSVQTKPKNSCTDSTNVELKNIDSAIVRPKFQPSIIKHKKKLTDENYSYCNISDNIMSIIVDNHVSINKDSDSIPIFTEIKKIDKNVIEKSLKCNKRTRNKSTASCTSESEQEENSKFKNFSYCNQQELAISKALEEVGVKDDTLQYVMTGDNVKVWKCHQNECGRQFAKLCSLKSHLLTHFRIKPFKCDYEGCLWAFYSEFKLKRHMETHLKKKDYVCSMPNCKRRFTTIYNLASHEKLHTRPNRVMCQVPDCNAKFQTKRALEIHMKTHDESLAPYVCTYEGCGKRYYGSNALMSHQRCHSYTQLDVTCNWPGCGKMFDQPCRLRAHMRSHTGLKPYACTFKGCKWAFTTSSKLKRHQKKHTNDRKFICDIGDCNKAFMRSEHLKEHRLTHREERFFQCHICASAFSAKSSLYVHIKKHTNKDFVSRTHRQTRKNKTVEKKVVNKKKETFCSRVQPVKVPISKMKKKSPTDECLDSKEDIVNQENNKSLEITNIAINLPTTTSPIENKISKSAYFCPIDSCGKRCSTKTGIRMHLQKEHTYLLSEMKNINLMQEVTSSPFLQENLMPTDPQPNVIKCSNQIQFESSSGDEKVTSTIQVNTVDELNTEESINIQDLHVSTKHEKLEQEINEGSARTAFTCETVLKLKPNRKIVNSSVGASDIVLNTANYVDSHLLIEDLPSTYYQEDIGVAGYQILLLDTGPTDGEINLRDLD